MTPNTLASRRNMALGQLYTNQVLNHRLLALFAEIPREAFVPPRLRGAAYADDDLNIGQGRVLMEPLVFARLLELAECQPEDRALVVACGYGYPAAILAHCCAHVTACESVKEMAEEAAARIRYLGAENVQVKHTPTITEGYAVGAPYHVILINGGIEVLPQSIANQLAEGGRLVAVQYFPANNAATHGCGKMVQYRKINGALFLNQSADAGVPLLPEFAQPSGFVW